VRKGLLIEALKLIKAGCFNISQRFVGQYTERVLLKGLRIFARRYYVHCRKIKQLTKETYLDDETEHIWDEKMEMRKYQRDLIECKMDQLNAHLSMIKKVMKYNDDRWNYYAHWKAEIIIATMGVVEN
jgi:hypothetical protein